MQSKYKIHAFIFARKNSKRIKNKNLKSLLGKSLFERSVNLAKQIKLVDKIFVSTDSKKIAQKAIELNCEVIMRPDNLTRDNSPELKSWKHAINFVEKKYKQKFIFLSLPTTSPLRKKKRCNKLYKLC